MGGLDLTPVKTRPVVIVSDTDLHGVSLGAALYKAVEPMGEENIAVVSHFDPKGPATTARGDLPALLRQLAGNVTEQHTVYFADVPLKIGAEQETVTALAELAKKARVVYIDHHIEVLKHFAGKQIPRVDFRIYADAFSTYLPALMSVVIAGRDADARHIFDLAVLGLVADVDLAALPVAQQVAAALGFEVPTLEQIRQNYHVVAAIDAMVKSPQKPNAETDAALVGNMASVVAYLAKKPLSEVASEALQKFPTPEPKEVARDAEIVGDAVAVYKKLAPLGQGAKYAALLEAALDVPIVVVAAPVPRVQEYVVVMAFANAFLGSKVTAEVSKLLSEAKEPIVKELKERKLTKDEWIRPTPGFSVPVDASKVEEALRLVAERLASLYAQKQREKIAAQVAREELTVLVADEKLAASVARIVEAAVNAAAQKVLEALKERR